MENHLNERVEKDAVQIPFRNSEIGNSSRNSEVIEFNRSSSQTVNNNLMLNQTNSSTILTFNDCKELTFGSVINIVSQNTQKQVSKSRRTNDESAYSKTPTIKEMLESSDPISSALLHSFCESFGTEWRKVTVVLKINQLFVDRMHEDYFIQFGTKEVLFKVLSQFFQETYPSLKLGEFASFLWYNGFRKTVWNTKDFYKKVKELYYLFEI